MLTATAAPGAAQSRWTNYLDSSVIREIVPRGGDLYMATNGGLVVYNTSTGSFESFGNLDGLPSNDLSCLLIQPDGTMYIGFTNIGIAKVVRSGGGVSVLRTLGELDDLAANVVTSVAQWGDDIVYGSTGGAGRISNDFPSALYRYTEGLPSNLVSDVLPVGDDAWAATDSGVAVIDRLDIIRRLSGGPGSPRLLAFDGQLVWVGTDDGAWTFDRNDSTWTPVGPVGEPVYSLDFDGQTVRVGAQRYFWEYQGGVAWAQRDARNAFLGYGLSPAACEIRAIAALGPDDIYLGVGSETLGKGLDLVHYDGATFTHRVPNNPGGNDVRRLSVDLDGSVWASFSSFWVGKLTPRGTWINYNHTIPASDSLSNQFQNLTCLADLDGYKWFCTLTRDPLAPRPLDRLDDKLDDDYGNDEWRHYVIGSGGGDGLGSLRLQRAVLDPAGNRWFLSDVYAGTPGWEGIHILSRDQSEWLQVRTDNSPLASGNVQDVAFGASVAYVGLNYEGVQRWTHGGYDWANLSNRGDDTWDTPFLFWPIPNKADGEKLAGVEAGSDGTLWVGTSQGVYRLPPGYQFPPGPYTPSARHYGQYNGFGTGLLGTNVWDILLDHDENLWVATPQGLNRISHDDPDQVDAYSTPAAYQAELFARLFPFDVISPLVDSRCQSLAIAPDKDVLYIGTRNGTSVFDFSPAPPPETDLSQVYVYPNPLYGRKGQNALYVANVTSPVTVEVYTLEGQLVHSQSAVASGDEVWDLTTAGGFVVASGVYMIRIGGASGQVVRTVSVIR